MPSTCSPGPTSLYEWIFACAPVPSTRDTEYVLSRTRCPLRIPKLYRSRARTGGPAVRLPSVSYWPPWHGQPKPAGTVGLKVTSPFAVFSLTDGRPRISPEGPFACTGHPRCAHRLEMMVKLGTCLPLEVTVPLFRTNAVRRETSPCSGSTVKVAMYHCPSFSLSIGPRSTSCRF